MVFHMKTTLVINDRVMSQLKQEAAKRRRTISELVEAALRTFLKHDLKGMTALPKLPVFHSGGARVDIANRDALYDVLDRK